MITYTLLFKTDSTRRIDSVIDYFSEVRPFARRRKAWLTRGRCWTRRRRRDLAKLFAMR